jgi:hypothetical protein
MLGNQHLLAHQEFSRKKLVAVEVWYWTVPRDRAFSKRFASVNWEAVARHPDCPKHIELFANYVMGSMTIHEVACRMGSRLSVVRGVRFPYIANWITANWFPMRKVTEYHTLVEDDSAQ